VTRKEDICATYGNLRYEIVHRRSMSLILLVHLAFLNILLRLSTVAIKHFS